MTTTPVPISETNLPPLPENTILLVEVGSTAHGTGVEGQEDLDQLGIVVESPEHVLGLGHGFKTVMHRSQPEGVRSGPGDIDRTLYSLREFLRLAAAGNPSILQALWTPTYLSTPLGTQLRDLAPYFVGRHLIPRYRGYMQGQVQRILGTKGGGHGRRGGAARPELVEKYGYDVKYAMHAARLGFQCLELLESGSLEFPIPGPVGKFLRFVRHGDVSFDDWWQIVLRLDKSLGKHLDASVSPYPSGPDWDVIENFSVEAHLEVWEQTTVTRVTPPGINWKLRDPGDQRFSRMKQAGGPFKGVRNER